MSMITEQVKQLEELSMADMSFYTEDDFRKACKDAADTIKTQSAKIHAYAMERSTIYYIVNSAYFPEDKIHQLDLVLKGEIPKEYDILAYKKAFEDIRAEIQDGFNACVDIIDNTKKGIYPQIHSDDQMEGRKITYEHCLSIIDKHNPDKAGKEKV